MKRKHYYRAMGMGLISMFLVATLLLSGDFLASGVPLTVYVSSTGDDSASGAIDQPVQTLARAKEIVRTQGEPGSKVLIRGGDYELTETLSFSSEDSGEANTPNMWANFPGENVNLYGSFSPNWSQTAQTTYTANLTGTVAENSQFEFLFRNGVRLTPARLPNWSQPDFTRRDPYLGSYYYTAQDQASVRNIVKYRPEDASLINGLAGQSGFSVYIDNHEGLWHWRYKRTVTAINTATRELTLDQDLPSNIVAGDLYWLEGSSTLLSGDEFYYNSADKSLTVQLSSALEPGERLSVPVVSDLVTTRASNFTWHGFRMSEYNSRAFTVDHTADRVTFRNNEVTNGKNGFMTEYWPATNLLVEGNHFHDLERGIAVGVFGGQFVKTLTPNGNIIRNNTINNIDIYGGAVGTSILVDKEQVGVEVSDNTISRVSRHGIIFEGNDHRILRNNISLWGQLRVDAAAINTGARTFIRQGTLVEGNYIFKQGSYVQRGYADWELTNDLSAANFNGIPIGIMLDDFASNIRVRKNIVRNVNGACISNHGGRGNVYEGNYLVDCHTGIYGDEPNLGSSFWKTIYDTAYNEVLSMAGNGYDTALYAARYPIIAEFLANPGQGEVMRNLAFSKNLFVHNQYTHKSHRADVTTYDGTGNVVRNKAGRTFFVTYEAPNSGSYSDINLSAWRGLGPDADLVEMSSSDLLFTDQATFTLAPSSIATLSGIEQLDTLIAGADQPSVPSPSLLVPSQVSSSMIATEFVLNNNLYDYQIVESVYRVKSTSEDSDVAWAEVPSLQAEIAIPNPVEGSSYTVCARSRLDVIASLAPINGLWSPEVCSQPVLLASTASRSPDDEPSVATGSSGGSETGSRTQNPSDGTEGSALSAAQDSNTTSGEPVPQSEKANSVIDQAIDAATMQIIEKADLPDTLASRQRVGNGLRVGLSLLLVTIFGVALWYVLRPRLLSLRSA